MALALRKRREEERARGKNEADEAAEAVIEAPFSIEIVRKVIAWKRRALASLRARRERRVLRLTNRTAEKAVELESFWLQVTLEELSTWSLRELRIACASRDLDQIGSRADLIDRILQQQRRDLKRVARAEALEKLQRERRGEARGCVYAFGVGYGPQHHSWDRLFVRGNLTILQALCGRGVVQISCGFDGKVCLCLLENGDVVSFGSVTPAEMGPLGYADSAGRRARGNRREEVLIGPTALGALTQMQEAAEASGGLVQSARSMTMSTPGRRNEQEDVEEYYDDDQDLGAGALPPIPMAPGIVARPPLDPALQELKDKGFEVGGIDEVGSTRTGLRSRGASRGHSRGATLRTATGAQTHQGSVVGPDPTPMEGVNRDDVIGMDHPYAAHEGGFAMRGNEDGYSATAARRVHTNAMLVQADSSDRDAMMATLRSARRREMDEQSTFRSDGGRIRAMGEAEQVEEEEDRNAQRPELGGPVSLQPFPESAQDSEVGTRLVKEATRPHPPPVLATQPHQTQLPPGRGGNVPAGATAPSRRVPLRVTPHPPPALEQLQKVEQAKERGQKQSEKKSNKKSDKKSEQQESDDDSEEDSNDEQEDESKEGQRVSAGVRQIAEDMEAKQDDVPWEDRDLTAVERRKRKVIRAAPDSVDRVGWGPIDPKRMGISGDPIVQNGQSGQDPVQASRDGPFLAGYPPPPLPSPPKQPETPLAPNSQTVINTSPQRTAMPPIRPIDPLANEYSVAGAARAQGMLPPPGATSSSDKVVSTSGDMVATTRLASRRNFGRGKGPTPAAVPWVTKEDREAWEAAGQAGKAVTEGGPEQKEAVGKLKEAVTREASKSKKTGGKWKGIMGRSAVSVAIRALAAGGKSEKALLRASRAGVPTVDAKSGRGGALRLTLQPIRSDAPDRSRPVLPLSGKELPPPKGLGISGVVTPRTAVRHSMLARGMELAALDSVGAEAAGSLTAAQARRPSIDLPLDDAMGDSSSNNQDTLPPMSSALLHKEDPLTVGRGHRAARPETVPRDMAVDDADPYAGEKEAKAREPWWLESKGGKRAEAAARTAAAARLAARQALAQREAEAARVRGDRAAALGFEGAAKRDAMEEEDDPQSRVGAVTFGGPAGGVDAGRARENDIGGLRSKAEVPFEAAEFGGSTNYSDIRARVDADMRGYAAFAPPTEVRELRGECSLLLACAGSHAAAVTSGGDVFLWGAAGSGALGLGEAGGFQPFPRMLDPGYDLGLPPGSRIVAVSCGSSHTILVTNHGEALAMGNASDGRLGLGAIRAHGPAPRSETRQLRRGRAGAPRVVSRAVPIPFFSAAVAAAAGRLASRRRVFQVACGAAHSLALTDDGVYAWGCGDGGRLGLPPPPSEITSDSKIPSHLRTGDATSTKYTLDATSTKYTSDATSTKYTSDATSSKSPLRRRQEQKILHREVPTPIPALRGEVVTQVAAAVWTSAAIVQQPPLHEGGLVYTWGSGSFGQLGHASLGQGEVVYEPAPVHVLQDRGVVAVEVSLGRYHSACLSTEGEVWTWGSNASNALGRPGSMIAQGSPPYDPVPRRAEGLREYGVGPIVSIACGDRCTFLSSAPYQPEAWPEWREREMAALDDARERREALLGAVHRGNEQQRQKRRELIHLARDERQRIMDLNRARPLCELAPPKDPETLGYHHEKFTARSQETAQNAASLTARAQTPGAENAAYADECTGFAPEAFNPDICAVCGHGRRTHTLLRRVPPLEELVERFSKQMEQ